MGHDRGEVAAPLGLFGELPDRGQHRPFDGDANGAVGGVARSAQRLRKIVGGAERLGGAPDDLREDHAGVPPSAHQGSAGHLARKLGAIVVSRPFERVDDRPHREREVGARVPVRHRIDVQVVDPAPVGLDRRQSAAGELQHTLSHAVTRTSSTTTSTAATGRPVSRSTS